MKRTHILHKHDNRAGKYFAQRDPRDQRPALVWRRAADEKQTMLLDGVVVAEIHPVGPREWDWNISGFNQQSEAAILAGPEAGTLRTLSDADAAKAFCERAFSGA